MICKQCGCDILNDSRFCENCGTKVEVTVTPEFQPIPVTPVYPPNSIYAQNAAVSQQLMVVPQPVPVQPQYVPAQPYQQIPGYVTPASAYKPYAEPAGSTKFPLILRIVSGVATGILSLIFLYAMISGDFESDKLIAVFMLSGLSIFTLVFSLIKKRMGKGTFLGLLIPNIINLYLIFSIIEL